MREEDRLRVVEAPGRERAGAADPAARRPRARAVRHVEALDERQLPAAPRGVRDLRGPEAMEVKVPRARLGAQRAREVRVVLRGAAPHGRDRALEELFAGRRVRRLTVRRRVPGRRCPEQQGAQPDRYGDHFHDAKLENPRPMARGLYNATILPLLLTGQ